MSEHKYVFIGMDTHKSFIEVAHIEDVCEVPLVGLSTRLDIYEPSFTLG